MDRRNEIKIRDLRSRVLQTPATAKTRRIPIAGNTEPEESWRGRQRRSPSRAIQPIRESAAIPAAKSAREGKLNNSPFHLRQYSFSGTDAGRKSATRDRVYSDDERFSVRRYLTEFDRLVCRASIYLKVFNRGKFVIDTAISDRFNQEDMPMFIFRNICIYYIYTFYIRINLSSDIRFTFKIIISLKIKISVMLSMIAP